MDYKSGGRKWKSLWGSREVTRELNVRERCFQKPCEASVQEGGRGQSAFCQMLPKSGKDEGWPIDGTMRRSLMILRRADLAD